MNSSSSPPRTKPNPQASRLIPGEQLREVTRWLPHAFDRPVAAVNEDRDEPVLTEAQWLDRLHEAQQAAHQEGYQAGYRDGLVALESFKQSFAMQTTARVNEWLERIEAEHEALQPLLARRVADIAVALAAQVVRQHLQDHPEAVSAVAQQAVLSLSQAARRMSVHLHPDDVGTLDAHTSELLASRQARIVADEALARGDCVVRSDLGTVDARVSERWAQAVASLGSGGSVLPPAAGQDAP